MDMEIITKDTNIFDNLLNRPEKPTSQEIADIVYPKPQGIVADTAYKIYSPNERVCGEWQQMVDGVLKKKPVYQRTFIVDTVTGETSGIYTTGVVASGLSDIQKVISMNGTYHAYSSDKYQYDIDIGNNTCRSYITTNEAKEKLSFLFSSFDKTIYYQNSAGMSFTELNLTIQYYKTTDAWQTVTE